MTKCHAGEFDGPGRVREAIEVLGVRRIQHGVRAIEDPAVVRLAAERGFTAVKHQREGGTGYFDAVTQTIEGGRSSTTALTGSTEEAQFHHDEAPEMRVA